MYISTWMAIFFYCLVQTTAGEVSLVSSPSYVCPSELVTLNCSVPDTDNRLVWILPNVEEGSFLDTIIIFCTTTHPNRRGPYQPAFVGCTDGKIFSTLVFNVSQDVTVTCGTGSDDALNKSILISPQGIPPPPIISVNATTLDRVGNDRGHSVDIQWEIPTEDINELAAVLSGVVLHFSPPVPECGHNCSLARDTSPLTAGQVSVTLEVGTRYEVVARAESCDGVLSSLWSDTLTIHWQAPSPTMMCVAVPTYDSAGGMKMVELNVAWPPLNSTEITPGISTSLLRYTVNYTTDAQSLEQRVSPSSCESQCRGSLNGDEVTSVITTVTVRAWNIFGGGEETICNNYPINNKNNIAMVIVDVTDCMAEVSLQWFQQQPVYPDLIQLFCSANLTHKEMGLCGETSDGQGRVATKKLRSNVTYFYKLEALGQQPFVVQGNFTTNTKAADGSKNTEDIAAIGATVFVVVLAATVVTGVVLCFRKWKKTGTSYQVKKLDPEYKFCIKHHSQLCKPRGIAVSDERIFVSDAWKKLDNPSKTYSTAPDCEDETSLTSSVTAAPKTDSTQHTIQVFDMEGNWVKEIGCNLMVPRGLDVYKNHLYVSNCGGGCGDAYVVKVLPNSSNSPPICTSKSNGIRLESCYGLIVVAEIDTVFICDKENHCVVATDLELKMKYTLGDKEVLQDPVDVAYNQHDLYVADNANPNKIAVFRVKKKMKQHSEPSYTFSETQNGETFKRMKSIHIAEGHIFVADAHEERNVVLMMDMERNLVAKIGEGILFNPTVVRVYNKIIYISSDIEGERKGLVYMYKLQPQK